MMEDFETELMDLIAKHRTLGVTADELISVLELRIFALQEDEEEQE